MKTIKYVVLAIAFFGIFKQAKGQHLNVNSTINYVITGYLGVKNALTADNNQETKAKAKTLLAAIKLVSVDKLTPDQRKLWLAYADKLAFDGRHISESGAIDHQREHFTSLSKNMYELVKGLKVNAVVLYEQYCPMKRATWLSETASIKNPYYGKTMLTCGKTTATLAAVAK